MIARLLYRLSARLPCKLIHRDAGEPYLERYFLGQVGRSYAYLHRFVAPDQDEEVHDHPWDWAYSLVLCGGYTEWRAVEVIWRIGALGFRSRCTGIGSIVSVGRDTCHRISDTQPETWTLFVHGPWVRPWGFIRCQSEILPDEVRADIDYRVQGSTNPKDPWWVYAPKGAESGRQPLEVS